MQLEKKNIAILATHGFEQSELEVPRERLKAAGAVVHVISLEAGEIKGWDKKDWGRPVKVDKTLADVSASDYDALVLPGGQINPDLLRGEPKALAFIKGIFNQTEAIVAVPDNLIMLERTRLAEFAREKRIPVISGWGEFAQSGGLLTYGPNSKKFFRRLAVYVSKIVAGAKPGEIPIEQPTAFELVINLKTAKSIGLTIPATLLARADEVIE